MKKKTVVSMVASSLLLAPFVLNQVVAADENLAELAPTKEVVTQVAPEPVASEGAASQSQADQAASVPSVDQKKEDVTSEPAIASPIDPTETEKVDKQVGQDKAVTTEDYNKALEKWKKDQAESNQKAQEELKDHVK